MNFFKENVWPILKIVLIAIAIAGGIIFGLGSIPGCVRVQYRENTEYLECNVGIMMAKIKSIKGNESFEISEYINECYTAINRARCTKKIYGEPAVYPTADYEVKTKKLDYLQCLSEGK